MKVLYINHVSPLAGSSRSLLELINCISANQVSPTQRLNYISPNTTNLVIPTSPNIFRLGALVKVSPPPILITRVIRFKEKPENGKLVGEVNAFDLGGESFTFLNQSDLFDGSLQIDEQGKIYVVDGTNLKYDSDYNAKEFKFKSIFVNELEFVPSLYIEENTPGKPIDQLLGDKIVSITKLFKKKL